jgi:hypothetical protein
MFAQRVLGGGGLRRISNFVDRVHLARAADFNDIRSRWANEIFVV